MLDGCVGMGGEQRRVMCWLALCVLQQAAYSAAMVLLQALALYMGHSIEMQRGTYDRRTKDQKVRFGYNMGKAASCAGVGASVHQCKVVVWCSCRGSVFTAPALPCRWSLRWSCWRS